MNKGVLEAWLKNYLIKGRPWERPETPKAGEGQLALLLEQFNRYTQLLQEWNEKVNLTAILDPDEIQVKHYLDSLLLLQADCWGPGLRIADVGSGAGFPGLPLKLVEPTAAIDFFDSSGKRVNFLNLVTAQLKISGAAAYHLRAEEAGRKPEFREKYDLAVSRAVAVLPLLLEYCLPLVKKGGFFAAYKGPAYQEELKASKKALELLCGRLVQVLAEELPQSQGSRSILIFEKTGNIPGKYPRRPGLPARQPLV
ncbi:MAG: 16S rRNA (guanine(527)-N(7))-methyltransferase RsmG [Peptococcaceae bacterium]|nr:16S rRNA (guanine(527)-N(7))-methyltransferase RsmG [Peptococcaceae bacterium]